ncbi:hypothetical protein AR275_25710 [Stenotrophomonas maltophilia]|nr:hypothetical protein AR275_25710 [Stenotrophomonas maltophilia]
MGAATLKLLKNDAYVVAMAPAVVFLGVYAYERGRYHFLKMPSEFIDLSANRLLAGGAVIGALVIALLGIGMWAWESARVKESWREFLAMLLVAIIFVGLPLGLWLSELPSLDHFRAQGGVPAKDWATLVTGLVIIARVILTFLAHLPPSGHAAVSAAGGAVKKGAGQRMTRYQLDSKLSVVRQFNWVVMTAGAVLAIWTASVFAGLGFAVERATSNRLCYQNKLVADIHGEFLLVKPFDPESGQLSDGVSIFELQGASLTACAPRLQGGKGLSFWGDLWPAL